jgi:hypothetical protein
MSDPRRPRTDRLGPPPIEPLSDLSWVRVERAVFAELDAAAAPVTGAPARRRWPVLIAPLAAVAALVVWLVVRPAVPDGGHEGPARIVTADSATELSFGDAVVTAAPRSTLVLGGNAQGGVLIVVERGGATFEVAPRAGRPPFRVEAGDVSIRVVGTRFTVARSAETATVQVIEGTVEIVARGRRVFVTAGESWPPGPSAAAPAAPVAPPAPAPPDTLDMPPAVVAPAEPPRRKPRPAAEDDEDDEDEAGPREPTSKEQFEAAARLERTEPGAALTRYRTLARGTGPWAANALFAAGRLSFDRGDGDMAHRLLTRYLRRFPGGANAADARALLDRL